MNIVPVKSANSNTSLKTIFILNRTLILFSVSIFFLYFFLFHLNASTWHFNGFDVYDADSREIYITSRLVYVNYDLVKHPFFYIANIPLFYLISHLVSNKLLASSIIFSLYPALIYFFFSASLQELQFTKRVWIFLPLFFVLTSSALSIYSIPETYSFTTLILSINVWLISKYAHIHRFRVFIALGLLAGILVLCHLSLVLFPISLVISYIYQSYSSRNLNKKKITLLAAYVIGMAITISLPFIMMKIAGADNIIMSTKSYADKYSDMHNFMSLSNYFNVIGNSLLSSITFSSEYPESQILRILPSFLSIFLIIAVILWIYTSTVSSRFNKIYHVTTNSTLTNVLQTCFVFTILNIIFIVYFHPPSAFLYSSFQLYLFMVFAASFAKILGDSSFET